MAGLTDLTPVLRAVTNEEAVSFFRQKGYRIGFDHRDVWQQEHQAAFTVAKATQIDLLKDIRAQVDGALANGTTFADFKRALMPAMKDRGWWGRKEVIDPESGEAVVAQLGSSRRLRKIFQTNLDTAYQEGQWQRIQATAGLFPFLEYGYSASEHPRLAHKAFAGITLAANDPWWLRHMPVKEYGCKCPVYQHSAASMERNGLKLGEPPKETMRQVVNQRTGEVMQIPVGVDPAFNYPPGGRRSSLAKMMLDKADAAGARTTARVLADGADTWAPLIDMEFEEFVGRYAAGERAEIGTRRVVGAMQPAALDALRHAGLQPAHATLSVELPKLDALLATDRGPVFVATLPSLLRRVGETFLDGQRLVMLCTADNDVGQVVEVVVDLNAPLPKGLGNSVASMRVIDPRTFRRTGLVPIRTSTR